VITFAHVESSAIGFDGSDAVGDQDVGIGVAIAVSVGGEIVGEKKIADLKKLTDGLAVISATPERNIAEL